MNIDKGQHIPIRRFFARALDTSVYLNVSTLILTVVYVFFNVEFNTVMVSLIMLISMILTETICISLFGTTLGKASLRISVFSMYGGKLSLKDAFFRTLLIAIFGVGLYAEYLAFIAPIGCFIYLLIKKSMFWDGEVEYLNDKLEFRNIIIYISLSIFMGVVQWLIIVSTLSIALI